MPDKLGLVLGIGLLLAMVYTLARFTFYDMH